MEYSLHDVLVILFKMGEGRTLSCESHLTTENSMHQADLASVPVKCDQSIKIHRRHAFLHENSSVYQTS